MDHDKLYYSISETASMLGVRTSVLRFWETQFPQIKPRKSARGIRSYTQADIALLQRILHLTRDCGFTLDGAREQLRQGVSDAERRAQAVAELRQARALLEQLRAEL